MKSKMFQGSVVNLINPSQSLIMSGRVVASEYIPTCRIAGCPCIDHDRGYYSVDMIFPEAWTNKDLYISPKTKTRHHRSYLRSEHEATKRAIGLPANSPAWAFTPEARRYEGEFCFGEGVNVFTTESGLTVVTLMVGCNDDNAQTGYWKEKYVFATSNGCSDDTKQFIRERKQSYKREFVANRLGERFSEDEALRMYEIPKEARFPWQLPILIATAGKMRKASVETLCRLIKAESRQEQDVVLGQLGITEIIGGRIHPQVRDFAEKALWIFHGTNLCDLEAENKPEMPAGPDPFEGGDVEPAKVNMEKFATPRREGKPKLKLKSGGLVRPIPTSVGNPLEQYWSPSSGTESNIFALGKLMADMLADNKRNQPH